MAKEDSPSEALDKIMKQTRQILKETVYEFHTALIKAAPVGTPESTGVKGYIGGHFKLSWRVKAIDEDHYIISNNASTKEQESYASILWRGRRSVNGIMRGSTQWMAGGEPMLQQREIVMGMKLKAIKE
ncbi:MAG: hypothetical protein J7K75_06435 [Desulfuromonas sp.]|nr:hypothetical protein [Desulfuromonas sp.]